MTGMDEDGPADADGPDGVGGAAAVLLIDVENMIGINARTALLAARVDALLACAGPGVPAVAACAAARITADGERELSARQVTLIKTETAGGAADQALLDEAARRARAGCRHFVVASNDSRFGQLAGLGRLDIVIWDTQEPRARSYAMRAASVRRLPRPGTVTARPAVPAEPAAAPARAGMPAWPEPRRTGRRQTAARWAAAGAAMLAGAALTGAGAVLGAAVASRILRSRPCIREDLA